MSMFSSTNTAKMGITHLELVRQPSLKLRLFSVQILHANLKIFPMDAHDHSLYFLVNL